MAGFIDIIKLIQDGDLVKAAIANRAPLQNNQNIRLLRDLFEAAMLGETIFARNRLVEIDAQVGQPVFFNSQTSRFERALGQVVVNDSDGSLRMADSSMVWGVVADKLSATSADILLHGTAVLDMSAAIVDDPLPGRLYHLSNSTPGRLTADRPPVGVAVLMLGQAETGGYSVYVNTKFHDLLDAHRHYRFALQPVPAGTHAPPTIGEQHVVTAGDENVEGWLPADHAVFGGLAPAGAAFGYNLSASSLRNLWPPLPLESCVLEWNRGEDKNLLGMTVPQSLCQFDRNGIWWMTDCYADVPWPTAYDSTDSVSSSVSVSACPRDLAMTLTLWFSKPVFQTTGSCVLSLTAEEGSGLTVTCPDDGEEASTGHLRLGLDLSLTLGEEDDDGYLAMKTLQPDGQIDRGTIVTGLSAGSSNVTLAGQVENADGSAAGRVAISVNVELSGREVQIDTVRVSGAEEEFYEDVIALGFRSGVLAEYRGRLNVPAGLELPDGQELKLRFWVLNRSSVDVPANVFSLSYRRIPAPEAGSPLSLPTSAAELDLADMPTATVDVTAANQYFLMESEPFEVSEGDTVLFTLQRAGNTDGFVGDLQILRQAGVYV